MLMQEHWKKPFTKLVRKSTRRECAIEVVVVLGDGYGLDEKKGNKVQYIVVSFRCIIEERQHS